MHKSARFVIIATMLLAFCPSTHAKIYKCVDSDGNTSFKESPCEVGEKRLEGKGLPKEKPTGSGDPIELNKAGLIGVWCFYEQSVVGADTVPETVTIELNENGTYSWVDKVWRQTGSWSLQGSSLEMSDVGRHTIKTLTADHVLMNRYSDMKWRRGRC